MELALLYSGGKDSSLAALLLAEFYDVRLVTAHFGVTDDFQHAREAAAELGFPFETVGLDRAVADDAVDRMYEDGFPRNGIQQAHDHALEQVADLAVDAIADGSRRDDRVPTVSRAAAQSLEDRHGVDYIAPLSGFGRGAVDAIADGSRRDDRVPTVSRAAAQSLEDRHGIDYIAPLSGFGRGAVDDLVAANLAVETGPSETVPKADYEGELRAVLAERHGKDAVDDVFPEHEQTYVHGRR